MRTPLNIEDGLLDKAAKLTGFKEIHRGHDEPFGGGRK